MRRHPRSESSNPQQQQHREMLLRPPDKTLKEKVRHFFWDPEKKMCLTRTPLNWLSITIYYVIFVSVVILLFYVSMLLVLYMSLQNQGRPMYILGESPIGSSPALNYFPLRDSYPLIWLREGASYDEYVKTINAVFDKYREANSNFSTKDFGECSQPPFGYDKNSPCVFFRLNRLLTWKPDPYKPGDQLPEDIPDEVKKIISSSSSPKVWLSCDGTTAKDRDHIKPDFFELQGAKGFDPSGFPFDGQKNFVDPIVAMKFSDKNKKKILYSFTCFAWAKGLDREKSGVDIAYYFE